MLLYRKTGRASASADGVSTKGRRRPRGRRVQAWLLRVQRDLSEMEKMWKDQLEMDPRNMKIFFLNLRPTGGLWAGRLFRFEFTIPVEYPNKPPHVILKTPIWHPNIDMQGNICLNVLKVGNLPNEDWLPVMSLSTVILGLNFLFCEPNPNDPLNIQAADQFAADYAAFERKARGMLPRD